MIQTHLSNSPSNVHLVGHLPVRAEESVVHDVAAENQVLHAI